MKSASRLRSSALAITVALVASGLVGLPSSVASAAPADDLFISEYIEGGSFNKAIEIYNGTGAPVDLAAGGYTLELYSNGAGAPSQSKSLAGIIADGDVYVLANSAAVNAVLVVADDVDANAVVNFNGDDAVVLRRNGAVLDAFGQVGFDPGSQWIGGGQNDTLVRNSDICAGDTDETNAFDASTEWVSLPQDTFDDLGMHTSDCSGGGGDPVLVINEVDADNTGTDAAEFIELYDGGSGSTDLTGTSIVFYNGSDDASYLAFDLDGLSTNADGYFVLCGDAANVANCDLDVTPDTNLIQNGADAAALYTADAVDFPNDTPITLDGLLDALVYDTNDSDDAGLLVLLNAGQPQINEGGTGSKDTDSNQRCPDGSGGTRNTDTYAQFAPTPGVSNLCEIVVPPLTCSSADAITLIHEVQGAGATSPIVGSEVVLEAVVTGIFPGLNGIYVQEEATDNDADPSTSEGIFVFSRDVPAGLAVGDQVRVQGAVTEFTSGSSSLTEISAAAVVGCGAVDAITPTVVVLPVASQDDFENLEGMLVTLTQTLTISEYFNFDRFGEVVVTTDRQLTPTAVVEPGADAVALAAEQALARITIDDGRTAGNPDPSIHPGNGEVFDLDNLFRGGDTITGVTGVIDDTFGLYRVQPTEYGVYTPVNDRTAVPDDVGGDLTVASFNVLNYFTTLDNSGSICGPAEDNGCRGADNAEELDRQRAKIVAALVAIDADVLGLIEIENNLNDDAVNDLVVSLNAAVGAGTYAAVETGAIGDDAIKVAFLYKPASVSLAGAYALLDGSVDPRFIDSKNRPVLAQSFVDNTGGGVFTVAVNHLKSKGSPCDDVGDPNLNDGSANCNGTRTNAAAALVDWLAGDPTASGSDKFLVIGDLNSYDKEDPIDAIIDGADDSSGTADDYTDLVREYLGEDAYSYVFDGKTGYLDHALANAGLIDDVTGVTVWHINSDEPDALDYDTSFKKDAQDAIFAPDPYRSSDHDPVIIGLDVCDVIAPTFDQLLVSPEVLSPPNHQYIDVAATVVVSDNSGIAPTISLLSVTSNEPDNGQGDGNTVNDIVIVDDFNFQLRAERSGGGDGRVYTITYEISDACGNTAIDSVVVTVPKGGKKNK